MEPKKNAIVVKNISLINAKYKYTTEEIKLLTIFISMLKRNNVDKLNDIIISFKEISNITGTIKNHKQLKEVCSRLQNSFRESPRL